MALSKSLRPWLATALAAVGLGAAGCWGDPQVGTIARPPEVKGTDSALDQILKAPAPKGAARKRLEKQQEKAPKAVNPRLADPNS